MGRPNTPPRGNLGAVGGNVGGGGMKKFWMWGYWKYIYNWYSWFYNEKLMILINNKFLRIDKFLY